MTPATLAAVVLYGAVTVMGVALLVVLGHARRRR